MRWWDVAVIVVVSVTGGSRLVDPPYGPDDFGAWACVGAVLVVCFASGAGRPRRDLPHHLVLAVAVRAPSSQSASRSSRPSHPAGLLYPLVWVDRTEPPERRRRERRRRRRHRRRLRGTVRPRRHPHGIGVAMLSLGFSLALGLWITRIAGVQRGARPAARRAGGRAGRTRGDAPRRRHHERARAARPRDPRHARAEPHRPGAAGAAGGQRLEEIDDERRGIRARRHRAHRADRARGARRGAGARRRKRRSRPTPGSPMRSVRLATRSPARPAWRSRRRADAALDRDLEVVLLRCAQEALANVRKHAEARTATIDVGGRARRRGGADRGGRRGRARPAPTSSGFGVGGMRERLALVGGRSSSTPEPTAGAARTSAARACRTPTEGGR